jgi:hypothetical protein
MPLSGIESRVSSFPGSLFKDLIKFLLALCGVRMRLEQAPKNACFRRHKRDETCIHVHLLCRTCYKSAIGQPGTLVGFGNSVSKDKGNVISEETGKYAPAIHTSSSGPLLYRFQRYEFHGKFLYQNLLMELSVNITRENLFWFVEVTHL